MIAPGSNLSIGLGDLAREAIGIPGYSLPKGIEPGLEQTVNFMPAGLAYSNSSHCVEVEVDIGTGFMPFSATSWSAIAGVSSTQ